MKVKAKERVNAQTSRKGWRPKKTSDARLARDIAGSITENAKYGEVKEPADYTSRVEIIDRVNQILSTR